MKIICSPYELMERIEKLTKDDRVCQVLIPGKGQVTIVFQTTESETIASEVQSDPELREMIQNSRHAYQQGVVMARVSVMQN